MSNLKASEQKASIESIQPEISVEAERTQGGFKIRVRGRDEIGFLFRLAAVLYAHGFSIRQGRLRSVEAGKAIDDEFTVLHEDTLTVPDCDAIRADLSRLLAGQTSALEYLQEKRAIIPDRQREWKGRAELFMDPAPSLMISGSDQRGLLLMLSQAFFLMDVDILEASIHTDKIGIVRNQFMINCTDGRFNNAEFRKRFLEEISVLI